MAGGISYYRHSFQSSVFAMAFALCQVGEERQSLSLCATAPRLNRLTPFRKCFRLLCAVLALSLFHAAPLAAQTYTAPTAAQVDAQVSGMLTGQNSYGWDPKYLGILINWRQDIPTQVNCGGANVCDTQPNTTRHDSINDIRDLQHLYWYEYRHPGDTTFTAAINGIENTTRSEWGTSSLDKGWVYGIMLRLSQYGSTATERAYWQNVITKYWAPGNYANLDPTYHVQINYNAGNCDCGSKTIYLAQSYRIPYALEIGADLIDAGARYNHPEWINAGYLSVQTIVNQIFVPAYGLTGRIFLISDPNYPNQNYVWDTQSQPQDNSEMAEALIRAAGIVGTSNIVSNSSTISTYLYSVANQLLSKMNAAAGLHDTTYGGYMEGIYIATNYDGTKAGTLENGYKEGRQLSLLGTAHLYDSFTNTTTFSAMESEMLRLNYAPNTPSITGSDGMLLPNTVKGTAPTVNGYPANTMGDTFEEYPNFGLYYTSGVDQNWISAEQNNLAMLGMQEWLSTPAPTVSALVTSATDISIGTKETLTATLTSSASATNLQTTPTGYVYFSDTFSSSTTQLGGCLLVSGTCSISTTALAVGSHSITAQYAGDTQFFATSNSSASTVKVGGYATTTTLGANPSTVNQGSQVTFTAGVSGSGAGTPTGSVNFLDGTTVIGAGTLTAGIATFSTSSLAVATHMITAVYSGDLNYGSSTSTAATVIVNGVPTPTQCVLTAAPSSVVVGSSVALSVSITNSSNGYAVASGNVTFYDGSTSLGVVALDVTGAATLNSTTLTVGSHSISAKYAGDTTHSASVSSNITVTITPVPVNSTTIIGTSATMISLGNSVTFTATVSSSGNGIATGTIDFYDDVNVIGSVPLNISGVATLTTTALAIGSHPISAGYEGDTTHNASNSSALTVVVTPPPATTTTTLTSSLPQAGVGQNVTFTSVVTATANGAATGTVNFYDGTTLLGVGTLDLSGTATYTISTLSIGTHTITAQYIGDSLHLTSSSSALLEAVGTANYALAIAPGTLTVSRSSTGSATATLTVTPNFGFAGAIQLTASGLPANAGIAFASTTITSNGSNTAIPVTFGVAINGQTPVAAVRWRNTSLVAFCSLLGLIFVRRRASRLAYCLILAGIASLTFSGCGSGGNTSASTAPSTPAGSYTITVAGTSGAESQTATFNLIVQ
jgi:hypothetical protein